MTNLLVAELHTKSVPNLVERIVAASKGSTVVTLTFGSDLYTDYCRNTVELNGVRLTYATHVD